MADRAGEVRVREHHVTLTQEYAGGWRWVCSCGAESRKSTDRWISEQRGEQHTRRAER
jgi:hypothetical protein